MSDSENTNTVKDESEKKEKKAIPVSVKKAQPVKTIEPLKSPKSDRLDRMERQLDLIEKGVLVLINSTQWHNLSITPVGTHDPNSTIDGHASLEDAIDALAHDDGEGIKQ